MEDELIEKIRATMNRGASFSRGGSLGIGDDAALWRVPNRREAILTCDWFLEGTHFFRDKHPPEAVGWKCLARALSDVAAMGGTPVCFLLSLAVPTALTGSWLDRFLVGLRRAVKKFSCPLAGGDTTRREQVLVNVTVIGEIPGRRAVLRSGARPGDIIFVSGRLGEAELGLRLVRESRRRITATNAALKKHLYPEPRLALGSWLSKNRLASAMMDLSDGLSTDLPRLCMSSKVGSRVYASMVPKPRISALAKRQPINSLALALNGGDDYELLFAVPKAKSDRIPARHRGVAITRIGEITASRDIILVNEDGRSLPFPNRGWDPFRASPEKSE